LEDINLRYNFLVESDGFPSFLKKNEIYKPDFFELASNFANSNLAHYTPIVLVFSSP